MFRRAILVAMVLVTVANLMPLPAAAQEGGTQTVELRDPELAQRYAYYFSGVGHFYTGETGRGAALAGVTLVGLWMGAGALGCSVAESSILNSDMGCSTAKLLLTWAAAGAAYVYGIIDAPKSAERMNAKRLAPARIGLNAGIEQGGRVSLGLRISLSSVRDR